MPIAEDPALNSGKPRSATRGPSETAIKISLLTFDDLYKAAGKMQASATKTKAGWGNLLSLINRVREKNTSTFDPALGAPWCITGLRLCGFQGTTSELDLHIDPSPGISIYHGPNGSGKSTIADGIRTAISGKTGWWDESVSATGRSKFDPLWEKINRARDSTHSWAEVTLVRDNEKLLLTCTLTDSGAVDEAFGTWTSSTGESHRVDMRSTTWRHALEGHPPVFSYAEVERRVQQSADLQRYITNLLALGGAFTFLEKLVSEHSEAAATSKKAIDSALRRGKTQVDEVDQRFLLKEPALAIADISWPAISDSINEWLSTHNLGDTGSPTAEVTSSDLEIFQISLAAVDAAFQRLEHAPDLLSPRIAQHLDALYRDVAEVSHPGAECPVCSSSVDTWVENLHANVERHAVLAPIHDEAKRSLNELRDTSIVVTRVAEILALVDSSGPVEKASSSAADQAAKKLRTVMSSYGCRPTAEVREAFIELRNSTAVAAWSRAALEAVEASEVTRQWLRERRSALEDFLHTWRTEQETATDYALWQETKKCSNALSEKLRKERTEHFKERADKRVRQLLEDVGIYLGGIHLTTTRADVSVSNASGQDLQLSMLSAGQRNAFLLAPLLSTAESGPFSFLILDDPVHAFDEIRVDRLASVLVDLSSDRRVVVFTHDERLKQHLLARATSSQAWRVSRDVEPGEIHIESTDEMWKVLLDDASNIMVYAPKSSSTFYLTEAQVVRGLCRQAIDIALHSCIVRYSLTQGRDVAGDVARIDAVNNTAKRVQEVREIVNLTHSDSNPIDEFMKACGHHLNRWNKAVHGANDNKENLRLEIKAARDACVIVTTWKFS
ncbi:energy-coupling factor transporter ATP-binding protein EcfA2 [Streptomyces sp. V3I8]|uniref:ATP-binding protein n=1 Tax=Streptomyces sp. V3I8 TaxID=3042279 RepID=UPI002786554A|nr:AAA family ATPase [Streptomyces sp. V3I8]MDQ1039657.1 energy-coupling factor transporter ATP-binding protein EcfA2 [Streptomyces sp. V3I8]